jgi:hypothetical protein
MKTSEVLRKAADEIRRRGWHQGDYKNEATGAVCAYGALNIAESGSPYSGGQSFRSRGYLLRVVKPRLGLATWNDDPRRTKDEVLENFEEAAVAAEADDD